MTLSCFAADPIPINPFTPFSQLYVNSVSELLLRLRLRLPLRIKDLHHFQARLGILQSVFPSIDISGEDYLCFNLGIGWNLVGGDKG